MADEETAKRRLWGQTIEKVISTGRELFGNDMRLYQIKR